MTTNYTYIPKATGTSYTKLPKPTTGMSTVGSPIGLLLSLTYAVPLGGIWTKLSKATGTSYTNVPKAT